MSVQPQQKWRGFAVDRFVVANRSAMIVKPDVHDPRGRWIWKPEFFNAFAGVDEALVQEGFHLFYMDVIDHYGCPSAIQYGNLAYEQLRSMYPLSVKTAFLALSRGGLFAYNWAVANLEKVSCIYADNPVCDIKSWPAGWGRGPGSVEDWKKCLAAYGLSEQDVPGFNGNPVDQIHHVARRRIPVLQVIGDMDEIVPIQENAAIIREKMSAHAGIYREIVRVNGKHHPHGLDDPSPIIEFFQEYT